MNRNDEQLARYEISQREAAVVSLSNERKQTYDRVKNFTSADSVKVDIAINHMKRIDLEIKKLNREIESRRNKFMRVNFSERYQ